MSAASEPSGRFPKLELAEFTNIRQGDDGMWRATHISSRREAIGETWNELVLSALIIRVGESMKRAWS